MWCAGLIPAFRSQPIARLRSRARLFRGETKPEGPFGEWMGYYSDDTQERPFVRVKTILHRNDPILTCAPQHKPVDETVAGRSLPPATIRWTRKLRPFCRAFSLAKLSRTSDIIR